MVCTRYIAGNKTETDLLGRFEGRTAFLVGGSPTLLLQDYGRLSDRNILSFGINNVGKTVRCAGYFFGDHPMCFFPSVTHDRSALRFFNRGYERYFRAASGLDDENLYFFTRINGTPAFDTIYGKDLTSLNNTLCMAVAALLSFKVSRIVLCGSSFDAGAYSHGKTLGDKERNWNSLLYTKQPEMLKGLSPLFDLLGVEFIDTSVASRLADTYRTMPLADALDAFCEKYSDTQATVPHCREARLSSGGQVDESISVEYHTFPSCDTPVFSGMHFPEDKEAKGAYVLLLLAFARSLAETNRGRRVVFLVTSPTLADPLFSIVAGYLAYWMGDLVSFLEITDDIRKDIFGDDGRFMRNLCCYLPVLCPDTPEAIWADADMLVRQDLSLFVMDGKNLLPANRFVFGSSARTASVNMGLLYMNLARMRDSKEAENIIARLQEGSPDSSLAAWGAINSVHPLSLDERWNVRVSELGLFAGRSGRDREMALSARVLHFNGDKRGIPETHNPGISELFRFLHGMFSELSASSIDSLMDFDSEGRWRKRIDKGE